MTLGYEETKEGKMLQSRDDDAKVRAVIRSKNLDQRNNGGYNVISGEDRPKVQVPVHERYNPIVPQSQRS